LKRVPVRQELDPVPEPIRTLDFTGFQVPVLDGILNLEKWFQNQFLGTLKLLGTLNFEGLRSLKKTIPRALREKTRWYFLEWEVVIQHKNSTATIFVFGLKREQTSPSTAMGENEVILLEWVFMGKKHPPTAADLSYPEMENLAFRAACAMGGSEDAPQSRGAALSAHPKAPTAPGGHLSFWLE
jgi:hypothetical protein